MPPSHTIVDWQLAGQVVYTYWLLFIAFLGVVGYSLRSPVGRSTRRFVDALRSAHAQSAKIDALTSKLAATQGQADDWRSRFTEVQERYAALKAEFDQLGKDMDDLWQRMTTVEEINRTLRLDRDALIDYSRQIIGQMWTQAKLMPAYPTPSLKSIINVPGPPLVVPGEPLPPKP